MAEPTEKEATIKTNLVGLWEELPKGVELVAVSKTHPPDVVKAAYDMGQRVFGENKAREMEEKHEALPKDIEWHFIGHLQRNKVKYIIPFVRMIHSVDSIRLLSEIDKRAKNSDRTVDCLIQVKIAKEESKFGLTFEQARTILHPDRLKEEFENIRICGLMGMASLTEDADQVREEFKSLKDFFDRMKETSCKDRPHFKTLSMGMTHDYKIAVEEGSNMVRIGSAIFGKRNYDN